MTSDEMGTGSEPASGTEQTPDTETKDMGKEAGSGLDASENTEDSAAGESNVRKPNLSKKQQEWLNKVFIPNFRKELMRQVDFDRKLLEKHKRELERRKKEEESHRKAVRAAREENEKLVGTISELKIDRALVSSAAANNAVNPDQVRKLLKDRVKLGENLEPMVLDENGERQLGGNGEFMTVEEQVKLFLAQNPHLLKASPTRAGSGSSGSGGAGHGFAGGATNGGDLIAEGLLEESKNHPTRTLAELDEG